jgi:hypothetical protein
MRQKQKSDLIERSVSPQAPSKSKALGNPKGLSTLSLSIHETARQQLRANMLDKHEMTRTVHWTSAIGISICGISPI